VIVMSNKVNTGATCYSSGTDFTNQVSTDTNANDCPGVYSLATQKPGDSATSDLDIRNEGNLAGTTLDVYASAPCAGTTVDAPGNFHGTGDLCGSVRLTVQEYASAAARTADDATGGRCWFGGNEGAGNLCTASATRTVGGFSAFTLGSPLALGTFPAATTRYFRVGVQLDPAAGNSAQGRSLTSRYVWRAAQ
jgi:hypothetical protein